MKQITIEYLLMALIDLHVQQINCKKGKSQNIQLIEHKIMNMIGWDIFLKS